VDSDKARLRRLWNARLASATRDETLDSVLEVWAEERGFDAVLATLALDGEPDVSGFYRRWLKNGHRLALARTESGGVMDFYWVTSLDGPWNIRKNGLREPTGAEKWTPGTKTLVLVPGLAFAPTPGGIIRLGRGGGYFDRWLALHGNQVTTLGIGFPFQITETLPREPHDVLLNGYFDNRGFHGPEPRTT
jgi:5-formyltetrahydrofolate cyclo-ligase